MPVKEDIFTAVSQSLSQEDKQAMFLLGMQKLGTDFSVYNLLSGFGGKQDVRLLIRYTTKILRPKGFNIANWMSNDPSILAALQRNLKKWNYKRSC